MVRGRHRAYDEIGLRLVERSKSKGNVTEYLLKIIDDPVDTLSTIIASQLPVSD